MNALSRKERELQERECRILKVAQKMLVQEGYHGLSMDRVAAELEYSKGTIYNHFSCKEEIIIALAVQTAEIRMQMFERAAAFKGKPRERLMAIGVAAALFVQLYPDHFTVEQIVRLSSIREKTSEKRRNVERMCEFRCVGAAAGIVRDGIAQGDLELPGGMTPEELVFGLWSMNFGSYAIINSTDSLTDIGIKDPIAALERNFAVFLDGCNFHPLYKDFDYELTDRRIREEVFPDECNRVRVA